MGEIYEINVCGYRKDFIFVFIVIFYFVLMIYVGGLKYLLLLVIIYGSGMILYLIVKCEQYQKVFNIYERILFIVFIVVVVVVIYSIVIGIIII